MIGPSDTSTQSQFVTTRSKAPEEKRLRFNKPEVVIPKAKVTKEGLYVPPPLRSTVQDEDEEEVDKENQKETQKGPIEVEKPKSRPFDAIIPINVDALPSSEESKKAEKHRDRLMVPTIKTNPAKERQMQNEMFKSSADEELAERIFRREIDLSVEELFAVSPAVKKAILRRAKNTKIRPRQMNAFVQGMPDGFMTIDEDERPAPAPFSYFSLEELEDPGFEVLLEEKEGLEAGAVVHRDIVEQFRKDRPIEDRGKKIVVVARKGEDLRVTFPKINHSNQEIETVLDSGSQIISMDTNIAVGLGLAWDPDVVIHMQSAHGDLQPTKGLARNVPFKFGDITVYLQVHIIDNVPYQVLLGRPFDVLVESEVKNTKEGDQQITITDPNSGRRCTIGTYARGKGVKVVERGPEKLVSENGPQNDTDIDSNDTNFLVTSRNC
jgi:hypothetical protein